MKLTIDRSNLLSAMTKVAGIVAKRSTIPILSSVHFEAFKDGRVVVRATNLDAEATVTTTADVSKAGAVCVDADRLFQIAKNVPEGAEIAVELGDKLAIKAGRSRFNLAVLPVIDFPHFPALDDSQTWEMPVADVAALLGRVSFAQGTDTSRHVLNGVHVFHANGLLGSVATNGHKLALFEYGHDAPDFAAIVPTGLAMEIVRMGDLGGMATVSVSASKISVDAGDVCLTGKLIDGTYPDFRRVVPSGLPHVINVDTGLLADALRRVTIISAEKTRSVRLTISAGSMSAHCRNTDGENSGEDVECGYDGDEMTIGLNSLYALETLASVGEQAVIECGDAQGPLLIHAPDDVRFSVTLMPLRA